MEKKVGSKSVSGFSKLSKKGKLLWIVNNFFKDPEHTMKELASYWVNNEEHQNLIDKMSENTITNFMLPYSVAPNFVINGREYAVPMVIEESSVVAAASKSAKYWSTRGGFKARVLSTIKEGTVYFTSGHTFATMTGHLDELDRKIRESTKDITANMEARGGGILQIELVDLTAEEPDLFKLNISFETCDSMGANFINSILECSAVILREWHPTLPHNEANNPSLEVIMAILTNYTPRCMVEAWVDCPVSDLTGIEGITPESFALKFEKAVRIAHIDPARATTHNKGIFNGIDAIVLATGNDFRAIEACGHTYAAHTGQYRSLTSCKVENGHFHFSIKLPMAVGTVGGLTSLHPMAKRSLELLDHPSAPELMMIIACTGLSQNFGAIKSLVTTGIQKGHMKMHLQNILLQLEATNLETTLAQEFFLDKIITFAAVREFLENLRIELKPDLTRE